MKLLDIVMRTLISSRFIEMLTPAIRGYTIGRPSDMERRSRVGVVECHINPNVE